MKSLVSITALACATLCVVAPAQASDFELISPEIAAGSTLPTRFEFNGFGCKGDNTVVVK